MTVHRLLWQILFFSQWSTHIFPDELGDGAGQHEAGDSAAQDVEDGVHDARAGGGAHWRTEGTAERAGGGPTATAYLRTWDQEKTGSQGR